jgi:hypothetical protein
MLSASMAWADSSEPFVTTVQGNRFRFRGGHPTLLSKNLEMLFQNQIKGLAIRARVAS